MAEPLVTILVAHTPGRIIGAQGRIPWHLPEDLKRFKARTMGHSIIMGRRTWESIGRPLPGRGSIVVTRDASWRAAGAHPAGTFDDALRTAASLPGSEEVFVIGGGEIYALALARADAIERTIVEQEVDGDAFFPVIDDREWRIEHDERRDGYRFERLHRVRPGANR